MVTRKIKLPPGIGEAFGAEYLPACSIKTAVRLTAKCRAGTFLLHFPPDQREFISKEIDELVIELETAIALFKAGAHVVCSA
jgi:hypothetical protein